jgi:hypothetical protein
MPYQSSNKLRDKSAGTVSDPSVEAASRAALAASGPNSKGDGSMGTTLTGLPFDEQKANRFQEDDAAD